MSSKGLLCGSPQGLLGDTVITKLLQQKAHQDAPQNLVFLTAVFFGQKKCLQGNLHRVAEGKMPLIWSPFFFQ